MREFLRKISTVLVLLVGSGFLYFNRTDLKGLADISSQQLIFLFLLTFLFFYLTGFTFSLLVRLLDVKLSQAEIIGLSILTNFGNYLGPIRPGAAFKAVYLKSNKGLNYSRFISILAANSFLTLLVTGCAGIILLTFLQYSNHQVPFPLYSICIIIICVACLPFVYNFPKFDKTNKLTQIFYSAVEGFEIIKRKKRKLLYVCITFIAQFFLAAIINMVTFGALGIQITFLSALIIGVFTAISNFFTITPNNLGVQEVVIAYLFSITELDFTTGVIGACLGRVVHILITFSLAPVFTHLLLKSDVDPKKRS